MLESRVVKSRRRGEVLRDAVLDAAWEELRERGWAGFRIDGVAQRAGTGKAAIYRRWPNRAALAQDAAHHQAADAAPERASSGDLRQDLVNFLEDAGRYLEGPFGEAARGIFAELDPADRVGRGAGELTGPPVGIVADIVTRARGKGVLGAETPGNAVLNVGVVLVTYEYLASGRAPTQALVAEIVDTVWLPALRAACADH